MKRYDYVPALLALIATGCWFGCGANKPTDQGAMVALDGTPTSIEPRGEPAAVFESTPAAQRTVTALEDPLRLELVRAYQRAGAAAGISVLPDERLDLAMDDLARAHGDGDRPR